MSSETSSSTTTTTISSSNDGNNNNNNSNVVIKPLNINIGIMGHVDSGKTSLAKALSTSLSTAALDKSPASQERGITLDLGFSAFHSELPDRLKSHPDVIANNYNQIQYTLVDCPGHASLIKTIIGGSQIIDMMFLVIDITKGIQTQTAECIVIGEITCKKAIVVLNKIDQLPIESRQNKIDVMTNKLKKVLEKTCFKDSPYVAISANPSSSSDAAPASAAATGDNNIGVDRLIKELTNYVELPRRDDQGPFLFEFDHCFQIKGQGSVMTGTVLRGSVEINQNIHIPQLNIEKKVKSMQMFHKPVKKASQGDRVGICVTQLDANLLERGLLCTPKTVPLLNGAIVAIEKVRFYKNEVKTKSQFHVTIGHSTVIATAIFFGNKKQQTEQQQQQPETMIENMTLNQFNSKLEYSYLDSLNATGQEYPVGSQYALLTFEHPVLCPLNSVIIGSKLDVNLDTSSCRIAFHGELVEGIDVTNKQLLNNHLHIYKIKAKEGQIERIHSESTLIGKNIFGKDTDLSKFIGMKVIFDNGVVGLLESGFGKTGKVKITLPASVDINTIKVGDTFKLHMKRMIFDKEKKNKQD
ncbi:Selenocysteine-specific elongation factor [Heterostelium album PN500]|uniref:Selenocysteine-specific elongation factor n=1 Tax=Heterostelium pallidum (strain ATCC 26659 / Pp 5 / PN500) TaxID=670386 RepID=D3BU07_HETP5|nr:Selenocysteine-specific elongation factor [Heterostelium album PN500]EFA75193.1 Selenocysteine-specific elongation factor [Heterostelium album PN500]|eukprot:XP_020427327.1 Selenocysteine-specific elongation factor [Heterostelium album PN500]